MEKHCTATHTVGIELQMFCTWNHLLGLDIHMMIMDTLLLMMMRYNKLVRGTLGMLKLFTRGSEIFHPKH